MSTSIPVGLNPKRCRDVYKSRFLELFLIYYVSLEKKHTHINVWAATWKMESILRSNCCRFGKRSLSSSLVLQICPKSQNFFLKSGPVSSLWSLFRVTSARLVSRGIGSDLSNGKVRKDLGEERFKWWLVGTNEGGLILEEKCGKDGLDGDGWVFPQALKNFGDVGCEYWKIIIKVLG